MSTPNSTTTIPNAAAGGNWRLGDRTINRIGLGAMRLCGMPWDQTPKSRQDAIGVLRRAVDLGVNHIDTAAFYFTAVRSANELISTALQPYPDDLVITTKVGPGRSRDGEFEPMARPDQLRGQVEENIRQLGVDHLDVVNLRWGAGLDKDPGSIADHFGALAELRTAGLIGDLGVSNVDADQLSEALSIAPVVCVQNRYGLTDRRDDDLVDLCGEHGIAFVPFFAVAGGSPGESPSQGAAEAEIALTVVAEAHGATPAQIRLAWTLHRGPHLLAIPGTGNPAHVDQNVAVGDIRLSRDDLARLDLSEEDRDVR